MKKIMVLSFGLVFLGSTFMFGAEASREAYHSYLTNTSSTKSQQYYRTRSGDVRWFLRDQKSRTGKGKNPTKNLRYSQVNKRDMYSRSRSTSSKKARHSTGRVTRMWNKKVMPSIVSLKNLNNAVSVFNTFENEAFSIQLPKGWDASFDNAHFFTQSNSDFTVSIKKVGVCNAISFTACAIALSKSENHNTANDKIAIGSRIQRLTQSSDTILNNTNVQTNTLTESFVGYVKGESQFISRYFVEDVDGGVYIIETQTGFRNAKNYIGVSKVIFDSFRIYAQ